MSESLEPGCGSLNPCSAADCVTLGRLIKFSVLQFTYLFNNEDRTYSLSGSKNYVSKVLTKH